MATLRILFLIGCFKFATTASNSVPCWDHDHKYFYSLSFISRCSKLARLSLIRCLLFSIKVGAYPWAATFSTLPKESEDDWVEQGGGLSKLLKIFYNKNLKNGGVGLIDKSKLKRFFIAFATKSFDPKKSLWIRTQGSMLQRNFWISLLHFL